MSQHLAHKTRPKNSDHQATRQRSNQPTRSPISSLALRAPTLQTKLEVNEPGDAFEREAETTADAVMRAPVPTAPPVDEPDAAPDVQRIAGPDEETVQRQTEPENETLQRQVRPDEVEVQRQTEPDTEIVQRSGETKPRVTPATAAAIHNPGSGDPLSPAMRQRIEPQVGANLSGVRVHTGSNANRAAGALQARAFTHGNQIFLNRAESSNNLRLMAHESTHVVQQGAAPLQRQPQVSEAPEQIQRLPGFITSRLASYARHIPGYTLFTVIIGFNPLSGSSVERNATNLVEGLMGLVPFGTAIFDKLQELGILQQAFNWIEGQMARLDLSLSRVERLIGEAWDEMDFLRLDPFDYNLGVLSRKFGGLLNDVRSFARSLVDQVIRLIKEAAIGVAEGLLAGNKAWDLIKMILHHDPLNDVPVEASTVEIVEAFLLLIGKEQELAQMRERGTLQETADWLDTQLGTFMGLLAQLRGMITAAWEAIQPQNLPNLMSNLRALANQAIGFLQGVWGFATTVAVKVLELIKNALLSWLSEFAHEVPGFHLITVILGRNPFTQEAVPRTPENIIKGFITLLPGGNETYQQLQESGAIGRAAGRIEGAIAELGISWGFIVGLFTGIWNSLVITDLINPIGAFLRIRNQFGEPISRLFAFIRVVVTEIFMLILEMMNFPTDLIGSIITNAMQAYEDIKSDPIGFFKNMLQAVKLGFSNFFDNILQHLIGGLVDWLFRGLRDAGIEPPTEISLESILNLVLQILGISMDRIWQKLGERFGEENIARIRGAIDKLVGIWNFVRDVQERGVAAIWEAIQSQISGLWDMVLEQARNWIMERIINRAIQWLLSLLDPTGIMPVINSFIAVFNAVQSAIEYMRDILAIINDYVTTIAAVARGDIQPGAEKMEQGLANAIPIAIGFLANQFGLGNIGEKIQEIIAGIRQLIDRALDWLLDQAESAWQGLMGMLGFGGQGEGTTEGEPGDYSHLQEPFTESDGEGRHRLYFEQRGGSYVLMIASVPESYEAFIDGVETGDDQNKASAKQRALVIAREIDQLIRQSASENADKTIELREKLDLLADQSAILFGTDAGVSTPPIWGPLNGAGFGTRMTIEYLTATPAPGISGSSPTSARNVVYDDSLNLRRQGGRSYYVKGHLLSEKLNGPGSWQNLTPLFQNSNQDHESSVENPLKSGIDDEEGRAFRYIVDVVYGRGRNDALIQKIRSSDDSAADKQVKERIVEAEAHVPTALSINAVEVDPKNRQEKSGVFSGLVTNRVDQSGHSAYQIESQPRPAPVNINDLSGLEAKLQSVPGIGPAIAEKIATTRRERDRPFGRWDVVAREVAGISEDRLRELNSQGYLVLGR